MPDISVSHQGIQVLVRRVGMPMYYWLILISNADTVCKLPHHDYRCKTTVPCTLMSSYQTHIQRSSPYIHPRLFPSFPSDHLVNTDPWVGLTPEFRNDPNLLYSQISLLKSRPSRA